MKTLSQSPGYQSLKAAYIKDAKQAGDSKAKGHSPMRSKQELYKRFQWVINRAKHYAAYKMLKIETILNGWELKRNCWWFGYYGESKQPKLTRHKIIYGDLNFYRNYYKIHYPNDPGARKKLLCGQIKYRQSGNRKLSGKKPRWSMGHKQQEQRRKSL